MASDPTIDYIDSLGFSLNGGNKIISISPNTFLAYINSTGSSYMFDFMDAPVSEVPLTLDGYKVNGSNLITAADNGSFGQYQPGISAGTSEDVAPYSGISNFNYAKYTLNSPDDGYYSICNILNLQTFNNVWHNCADHTNGDETGRLMIVNKYDPNEYFFTETISNLNPTKKYLFSAWFLNLYRFTGYTPPLFKLKIISSMNRVLVEKDITKIYYSTTIPTWKEMGISVDLNNLNSNEIENNTASITFQMVSSYQEAVGNDFLVDDVSVRQIVKSEAILTKSSDKSIYSLDETIQYTSIFTNYLNDTVSDLIFQDSLLNGAELVNINNESENFIISVNGFSSSINVTKTQLSEGINISDILKQSNIPYTILNYMELNEGLIPNDVSITFSFSIKITNFDLLDSKPVIYNYSSCSYIDTTNLFLDSITSNVSKATLLYPEISVKKLLSKMIDDIEVDFENNSSLYVNEDFIYKIIITNAGTINVSDIVIADNIDESILPMYSINSDCTGITKQTASPISTSEINVLCSEITKIDNNINNIEISNINVPEADIDYINNDKVITPGITIVRIHCRVKS